MSFLSETQIHELKNKCTSDLSLLGKIYRSKKDILLSIGQNHILYEGRLQINPNEWLEPVRINAKSLRDRLDKVRTLPEQMKKASEEAICLEWQGVLVQVRTLLTTATI